MTQTIERPLNTQERPGDLHLDLAKISVSENLPENSYFTLQTTEPTVDSPVAVYVATARSDNEGDTAANESLFAVKENAEAVWKVADRADAISLIRGRQDGSLEPLGAGQDDYRSGTFKIETGDTLYMVPQQFVTDLQANGSLNKADLEAVVADPELNTEIIRLSFDDAIVDTDPTVADKLAKSSAYAKRMEKKRLKSLQSANEAVPADGVSSTEPETVLDDKQELQVDTPSDDEKNSNGALAFLRRQRARNEKTQQSSSPTETTDVADALGEASPADTSDEMTDEERQYIEDERRGFKVTDKRKWSRVEVLGHEVGIHSDVSFTVPAPKPTEPKPAAAKDTASEASTEILPLIDLDSTVADEVVEQEKQEPAPTKEITPVVVKGSTVPFEVVDYNPNNDPAIEHGLARLDALRTKMADLTANRQNRLFSLNGKKSRETAKEYNDQLLALGRIVTADKLHDNSLTDSQKNIAVTKFVINEQALLQAATKEKLEGTKEGKFVDWMSIHGRTADSAADVQKVMRAIELDTTGTVKLEFAHWHMERLYNERIRSEKRERLQGATRIVALGVVGMAAMAFGINPSTAGDAANNIFYGARKK